MSKNELIFFSISMFGFGVGMALLCAGLWFRDTDTIVSGAMVGATGLSFCAVVVGTSD